MATQRIEERKARYKEARRAQILDAARQIAEAEGWPNVTVRRLSDEISYSQPVLYSHFAKREDIVTAIAVAGFEELGLVLEKARQQERRRNPVEAVANAYLEFAAGSPALYEAMFSLGLSVKFDDPTTPRELHFAFSQVFELFSGQGTRPEILSELFWANLHGIAEWVRTKRFPPNRQRDRVKALVELFGSLSQKTSEGLKKAKMPRLR